jgi:hypothetical protein
LLFRLQFEGYKQSMRPTLEDLASALDHGSMALHGAARVWGKGPVGTLLRLAADRFAARAKRVRARIERGHASFNEATLDPLDGTEEATTRETALGDESKTEKVTARYGDLPPDS